MTNRNYKDKNQNEWEWEETPETIEALKQLHETIKKVNGRRNILSFRNFNIFGVFISNC